MTKVLIIIMTMLSVCLSNVYGSTSAVRAFPEPEPERLMNLFLKTIQSGNKEEALKFINENYSDQFKQLPIDVHLKVLNDLHRDFSKYIVERKTVKGNSITVIIKSPVNKQKQITIETDGKEPAKIFIINTKQPQ